MGDAEDGDESVGAGDGHFGDERFDEGFDLVVGAAGDDLGDVIGDRGEGLGLGCGGFVVQRQKQLVAAGAELFGLGS
ncbi:hypothetical protein [Amycolatopsis rhizosphaerae]|uniref:hypothetical protein n=1 Tax=Amycolatopsis rhizosphaerae TaxID=2053003 RepID=UPI001FEB8C2C|nr:hypothetical protein [Amycolatopsis rhizosphaerae]